MPIEHWGSGDSDDGRLLAALPRDLIQKYLMRPEQRQVLPETPAAGREDVRQAWRVFLTAGREALEAAWTDDPWFEVRLATAFPIHGSLYREILAVIEHLFESGCANNAYFMHKPPGLRLRIQVRSATIGSSARVVEELGRIRSLPDLSGSSVYCYEAEEFLFGGVCSVPFVHRMFSADTLAFLRFHSLVGAGVVRARRVMIWKLSIAMIRVTMSSLGILGREAFDVWMKVRSQGRGLAGGVTDMHAENGLVELVGNCWNSKDWRENLCDRPALVAIADEYGETACREGPRWIERCVQTGLTRKGPRTVCASLIVFHWNRGGFTLAEQCFIVESILASVDA